MANGNGVRGPYRAAALARKAVPQERVVVTIPQELMMEFDRLAAEAGFVSRADAFRELVRKEVGAMLAARSAPQRQESGQ